jgi:signal transduction histidine kinase
VHDILDYSMIKAGKFKLNLKDVDIKEVIINTISVISFQAQQKGIQIVTKFDDNIPHYINTDERRVT